MLAHMLHMHACMLTYLEGGWVVISAQGELLAAGKDLQEYGMEDLKATTICEVPHTVMRKVRNYDSGSIVSSDFGCCVETARPGIHTNSGQHVSDTQARKDILFVEIYLTN